MCLLYIDPGTGSMLFTVVIGIALAVVFSVQKLLVKIKFLIRGGRVGNQNSGSIPYLIFCENKRYWNTFKPICDEFEKRKISLEYWTASPDDPANKENYEYVKVVFIGEENKAFARLNMLNAGICFATTPGLGVYQWKRSPNVQWYIHIPHAAGDITLYRMFGLDFYDAVITSGDFQEEQLRDLERIRGLHAKELISGGLTYLDMLKIRYDENGGERVKQDGTCTVLLAPSWGESSILSRFGEKIIDALLDTGYKIVIRPHPQSLTSDKDILDPLVKKYSGSDRLFWNYDSDNFDALNASDVLISDFSGVIYDYTFIFDKPVIYADTSFDKGPYDAWQLESDLWVFKVLPRIGIPLEEKDFGNIKDIISRSLKDEQLKKSREEVRAAGWKNIGHCAEAVTDYMLEKYRELNPVQGENQMDDNSQTEKEKEGDHE